MWSSENKGARFWLGVATKLKNRGVSDIFICCIDGLSGFGGALESVFPNTRIPALHRSHDPQQPYIRGLKRA